MKKLILLITALSFSAFAQYSPRVDVGTGFQKVGEYVDVLVKLDGYAHKGSNTDFTRYYVLTFKTEGAYNLDTSEVTSMMLDISLLKADATLNYDRLKTYVGFTLLDYKYSRNIDINQWGTHTLTVVGFRAGGQADLNKTGSLKGYANIAMSFAALFMQTERFDDGQDITGIGASDAHTYNLDFGVAYKKASVTFGARGQVLRSQGFVSGYYINCDQYFCWTNPSYSYTEFHGLRELYVDFNYNFTSRFNAFVKLARRSYRVRDYAGEVAPSRDAATYIQVGAKYKFGGKKKQKKPKF